MVLIDDGKLKLRIEEVAKGSATARVLVGGRVSNRKGVSLPDTEIPVSAMTQKDQSDLEAGLNAGVDWVAVSFVQRPEDIAAVKKIAGGRAQVLAKIDLLGPRKSGEVVFKAPTTPGEYVYLCSFPAHFQVGMKGVLIVK